MPDAHWVRYRQIRGGDAPSRFQHADIDYQRVRVLKRDFYAVTAHYEPEPADASGDVLLKIYHTDRLGLLPLGWLGRWLAARERDFLGRLNGIDGVPQLLGPHGDSGLVREFVPGCNLREFAAQQQPDHDFFPRLSRILGEVHARGISHNDLSKPENVLVTPDGRPILIDLQIAQRTQFASWPILGALSRQTIRYLQGVDRYHLTKLHRRRRPQDFTADQLAQARKKGLVLQLHALIRRPYRAVRHLVMRRYLIINDPTANSAA